ncbi:MAG: hypothetical protein EBT07_14925, partial [Actinobacteria bacterium]|nr:hypothetical protein [Actinomycetota bacterium]
MSNGIITTFAGTGIIGSSGDNSTGPAISYNLNHPRGIFLDNTGNVYIASARIHKINAMNKNISSVAGGVMFGYGANNVPAESTTQVMLNLPCNVCLDSQGNVYFTDTNNHRIRKVSTSGIITTIAGASGSVLASTSITLARLTYPFGIFIDSSNNIYISDTGNHRICKINSTGNTLTTIAGDGTPGYLGDNISATSSRLLNPRGIFVDNDRNIYIADTGNHRIRKIDNNGIISTIAGGGGVDGGYSGDNGIATSAKLYNPYGVCLDLSKNVYIADTSNNRIRKVDVNTQIISTIAGNYNSGYAGDGGLATSAQLNNPTDVKVDMSNNVYICDTDNNRVRKITFPINLPTTIPNTTFPNTTVPNTTFPNTTRPNTTFPNTTVPNTTFPNTTRPNTTFPNTTVPNTTFPNTTVPNTTFPNTTVPNTTFPNTTVPNTTFPNTTVPNTTFPNTTVPNTTFPNTTVPNTTFPNTTVPNTTFPNTTVPNTTFPNTTVPNTTFPNTTVPNTTFPNTTVPNTTFPNTTVPNTTFPNTTVPNTTFPNTTVPNTTFPNTTVPNTTFPNTTVPNTTFPNTTVPNTTFPNTTVPNTTFPNTT